MMYHAKNLHDIAEHFEQMAKTYEDATNDLGRSRTERATILAQADTWKKAATIVRNTEIDVNT